MQPTPICEVVRREKRQRAAQYREQAAQFEMVAQSESGPAARTRLLDMAVQYYGLANRLEEDLKQYA